MTGYAHPGYAQSLAEFGKPRVLPHCGGCILERNIPGFAGRDGLGCYPLFTCQNWSKLHLDLEGLRNDLVCLSLVAEPFGAYDEPYLRTCFKDVMVSFKEHFITDLTRPVAEIVSKHHRYYARKASKEVTIDVLAEPVKFVQDWVNLYAVLVEKFHLGGIKAFSRQAFTQQLALPGLVAFRAMARGATVGAHLWYVQGEVAYSHLAAYTSEGYKLMAAYPLYWHALKYFTHKVRWLDLGAGAGASTRADSGLDFFKRGWSTGTRTAFLCGVILDPNQYQEALQSRGIPANAYFPAYRRGEFG